MDSAVSLVQAYLRVNGYFTVTEFPVVELPLRQPYRTATDLDLLALRFPGAGRLIPGEDERPPRRHPRFVVDQELDAPEDSVDMIVGEVKEARAEFNPAGLRAEILRAALIRFGCCHDDVAAESLARDVLRWGHGWTHGGHRVRLVAFGAKTPGVTSVPYLRISLGHVLRFLENYVSEHWEVLKHTQSKDPVLGFLMMSHKARRAAPAPTTGAL